MSRDVAALTEREKQTLRLIVHGHDAKSTARHLGLSVHTINERLREARRKLAVSSSREAARLLLQHEGRAPQSSVPSDIGEALPPPWSDGQPSPISGGKRTHRSALTLIGAALMSLVLGLLTLATLSPDAQSGAVAPAPVAVAAAAEPTDVAVETAARQWLVLLDQSRWAESWAATARTFRSLNTVQRWTAASLQARAPLGAMVSRTLVSHENLPAPPHGYEVVKFRTRFANQAEAVETVTLDREDGGWRVVGVAIG